MRIKKRIYFIDYLKYLFFAASLIMMACHPHHPKKVLQSPFHPENYYATIDSLVKSISADTVALANYLALSVSTGDKYAEMCVYDKLGSYFLRTYLYHRAIGYHKAYLETAESLGNILYQIRALNCLAYDFSQIRAYDITAEYFFKALARTNKCEIETQIELEREKVKTLNGIGEIYLSINQPNEANIFFQDALQLAVDVRNPEDMAQTLKNMGTVYELNKQYDSAHALYQKSLEYHIKSNSVSGLNNCFWHIGNLYMIEGDYENALVYLESAHVSLLHTSDRLNRLNVTISLGEVNIKKKGNYAQAEVYLQNALRVSSDFSLSDYSEKIYFHLSDLHMMEGKHALALKERSLGDAYAVIFNNEMNLSRITMHRLNYEKEMKVDEMNMLTRQYQIKEEKTRKALTITVIFILILILVIYILIQYFGLKKGKNQKNLQLEKTKFEFYTKISQEFIIPVSILIGLSERLKKNLQDNNADHAIEMEMISRQSETIFSLINEMTTLNNLQQNKKVINANIISYLRNLYECFVPMVETKQIDYIFSSNVSEIYLDYIPEYIRVIMHNLLNHAVTYCKEYTNITVSIHCDRKKKRYAIEVIYNGTSINQEGLLHVFDFDFLIKNKKSIENDSEVGLIITKQLIEKMNGTIVVNSDGMNNTVFTVSLPIRHDSHPESQEPISISKQITGNHSLISNNYQIENSEKPVVLIVEKNRDLCCYLISILKDKYALLTEINGENAIKTAQEKIPDVIISDVTLPLLDGFQLCEKLKSSLATNHIPIILLTLMHSKEDRIKGIKNGADAFLSKPVYEEEVLALMDQLLSTRKQLREKYNPFIRTSTHREEKDIDGNSANMEFLQRVTNLIYKELTNTENIIEKISSEICLSSSQLNRKMKAISGLTTTNYILKTRLNQAQKLLIHTHKPIGDIAMESGFNDFAYFSRSFKKEFGMTPTTFQRIPTRNKLTDTSQKFN